MADPVPTETITLNYEEIKWTYSKADATEDSFDFSTGLDEDETAGLLLPAVQKAREDRAGESLEKAIGSFVFTPNDNETFYEYKLDGVMITSHSTTGSADDGHGGWIEILSMPPVASDASDQTVREAGLRSDGELVQAVSDAEMGGDFIL